MEKIKFDGFINRYNLGGEVESVMVKSDGKVVSVKMISDDKTLLGSVTFIEKEFPEGEFGIYTTSQLKSMLGILDDAIKVESITTALKFSDNDTKVQYMLASPSVIPAVPELKALPEFDASITMNDEFINKFIKSKSALPDSDTFTFIFKEKKGEIILGYSTINSNRVSIAVDCKCSNDIEPIAFSAKYLKGILVANKGSKNASMQISSKGLAFLTFSDGVYESNYYLVKIQ